LLGASSILRQLLSHFGKDLRFHQYSLPFISLAGAPETHDDGAARALCFEPPRRVYQLNRSEMDEDLIAAGDPASITQGQKTRW
jgi:hypothetical protein